MSRSSQFRPQRPPGNRRTMIYVVIGLILISMIVCATSVMGVATWVMGKFSNNPTSEATAPSLPNWTADSADLTIAVSPVMAPVLKELADRFNQQGQKTPDNKAMTVQTISLEPIKMVQQAVQAPNFQAISPDSSLWLDRLEQAWSKQAGTQQNGTGIPLAQQRTGTQVRYAVSPVVIAAWESVAKELGWPNKPIGWQDIQRKATQDANFKWNHPSTNNASGLLATLAEFYAGAGLTRGLTEQAATDQKTLDYVQAVEATVRFYGEGEEVITQRLASEGRNFLDAFVAQERTVIEWNRAAKGERLVAIYPAEGTLWTDHPLALLELSNSQANERVVTDNQRLTFQAFAKFLDSADAQQSLLNAGYRPADLSIKLDTAGSPFANTDAVDWRQPQTTLQMPAPAVVDVIQNFWYYTKRPTNVYLVVDTSGSMEGTKLTRTKAALTSFVGQIKGEKDRVGIVEFGSGTKNFTPLRVLDENARNDTLNQINQMTASGGTALVDAVYNAITDLQAQGDTKAINAIVVMTDGKENESQHTLNNIRNLINSNTNTRLVIFTIGFGSDADVDLLTNMAQIGNGQFRRADETDIEELYKIISTYF